VKKYVVEQKIKLETYKDILDNRDIFKVKQNGFISDHHEIFTQMQTKIALSCKDDKTYICDNNIDCYNFGHYKTTL
jgi:hypothetical protein